MLPPQRKNASLKDGVNRKVIGQNACDDGKIWYGMIWYGMPNYARDEEMFGRDSDDVVVVQIARHQAVL